MCIGAKDVKVLALTQARDSVQTPSLSHRASLARLVKIHRRVTALQGSGGRNHESIDVAVIVAVGGLQERGW